MNAKILHTPKYDELKMQHDAILARIEFITATLNAGASKSDRSRLGHERSRWTKELETVKEAMAAEPIKRSAAELAEAILIALRTDLEGYQKLQIELAAKFGADPIDAMKSYADHIIIAKVNVSWFENLIHVISFEAAKARKFSLVSVVKQIEESIENTQREALRRVRSGISRSSNPVSNLVDEYEAKAYADIADGDYGRHSELRWKLATAKSALEQDEVMFDEPEVAAAWDAWMPMMGKERSHWVAVFCHGIEEAHKQIAKVLGTSNLNSWASSGYGIWRASTDSVEYALLEVSFVPVAKDGGEKLTEWTVRAHSVEEAREKLIEIRREADYNSSIRRNWDQFDGEIVEK